MSNLSCYSRKSEAGFSLIELLVTMVVVMVILGGLLLSFTQQNSEYKYQNKRIDAVQDLEFAIKFIAEDLRSALVHKGAPSTPVTIADGVGGDPYTFTVDFNVWESEINDWHSAAQRDTYSFQAVRHYEYDAGNRSLEYDRNTVPATSPIEILSNVTFFKIFNDSDLETYPRGNFTGIPSNQSDITLLRFGDGTDVDVPGYTILIEIEVDAGYKQGSLKNVKNADTTKKRIWRYVQVYPLTVVD